MILTLLPGPQDDTTIPPSQLLTLLPPGHLQSLCSCSTLKICLQHRPQPSLCLRTPATHHPHTSILHPYCTVACWCTQSMQSRKYAEWPSLPTGPKGKSVSIFTVLWLGFKSL
ncbi:hypothetical protein O181_072818 [Austropuccinia psidii MF-1]|uniref:Uncharacterized protein n=1 Tax=Austropuccinia psidii MF-1 TaxID=1389203 RepID=A0A9Q3F3R0_9BASI|nr:hypothetical protein [Austropuccinia psidii MF-1]